MTSEDVQKGYEDPTAVKIKEECQDQFDEEMKVDCQDQSLEEIKTSTGDTEVIKVIVILFISYAE